MLPVEFEISGEDIDVDKGLAVLVDGLYGQLSGDYDTLSFLEIVHDSGLGGCDVIVGGVLLSLPDIVHRYSEGHVLLPALVVEKSGIRDEIAADGDVLHILWFLRCTHF